MCRQAALECSCMCRPMKMFVVLVILGSIGSKHNVKLDKRYKLPKMRYKGPGPLPQTVRAERPALISEVRSSLCLSGRLEMDMRAW